MGVEACELHSLRCHGVDARRAILARAEGPDIPVAHVVDEDEHEIGRSPGSRLPGAVVLPHASAVTASAVAVRDRKALACRQYLLTRRPAAAMLRLLVWIFQRFDQLRHHVEQSATIP